MGHAGATAGDGAVRQRSWIHNSRFVASSSVLESAMSAKQSVLGLVYTGSQVRRPPLIGMQFLHEGAVRPTDLVASRPRPAGRGSDRPPQPSFCRASPSGLPPCPVAIRVLTPGGKSAVKIAFK